MSTRPPFGSVKKADALLNLKTCDVCKCWPVPKGLKKSPLTANLVFEPEFPKFQNVVDVCDAAFISFYNHRCTR